MFRKLNMKFILRCSFQFILLTLREKFVNNLSISKTEKMKLFSVANLKPILLLCYKWKPATAGKGPDEEVDEEETAQLVRQVGEAGREFLIALLTSHKLGVVFHDPTVGTSGSNQNHLLLVGEFLCVCVCLIGETLRLTVSTRFEM